MIRALIKFRMICTLAVRIFSFQHYRLFLKNIYQPARLAHTTHTLMEGYLSPLETGRLIAETGRDVKVKAAGVSKVAKVMYESVKNQTYSIKSWKEHELNPKVRWF